MSINKPISIGYLGTIQNKAKAIKERITNLATNHIEILKIIATDYAIGIKESKGKENEDKLIEDIENKRNKSLEKEQEKFEKEQETLQLELENILSQIIDPFLNQKIEKIQSDLEAKKAELENKANASAAKKEIIKKILKTLPPILGFLLGKAIVALVVNNKKLKKLVNQTNEYITLANKSNNLSFLTSAKNKRADAVRVLDKSEKKVTEIKKIIDTITTILTILILIVSILESLPQIPAEIKEKIAKYKAIAELINLVLKIVSPILQKEINLIRKLRAQLKQIGDIFERIEIDKLTPSQILALLATPTNTEFEIYKGFKFIIQEETGPKAIVIKGNKRRYAAALDTNNVEVLKSDSSFTLDPNDLIEQLKLIIDRENLIA